jgi:succinoglycan biosynthesis transport protein ExoP
VTRTSSSPSEPTAPWSSLVFSREISERLHTAAALILKRAKNRSIVLVITSSEPGAGKTTVSFQLARVFSTMSKRVLLVDGDFRRRTLTQLLGLQGGGLVETQGHSAELVDGVSGLWAIGPGLGRNSLLLSVDAVAKDPGVREIFTSYDITLIDSPPLSVCDDALAWANHVDGALFVLPGSARRLKRERDSAQKLTDQHIPIWGLVVNGQKERQARSQKGNLLSSFARALGIYP